MAINGSVSMSLDRSRKIGVAYALAAFGSVDWQTTTLLVLAGAVTTFPLVWFTSGCAGFS